MMDDLLAPAPDDVLAVTDLTRRIKRILEGEIGRVWVRGEVSNLRRQSSGHVYFSLKDDGSQLPCVLFARDAARQSFQLSDGMELVLFGELSVYAPHGRYQLIAKVAIQSGEGRLQLEFERLKRKLAAEGLFDAERKRELPTLPRRIAVITSPTGAALRDFLRILSRRGYAGEIVVFPARVQGKEAPVEIRGMLAHAAASEGFDLIVLTRGGGSIEDLWAFNDEALARAVVDCPIPVISAVGHEIDHVLTDYAADRRAETPSGAAELISSVYLDAGQRLGEATQSLCRAFESMLRSISQAQERLNARLQMIAPQRQVELRGMELDEYENRLRHSLQLQLRAHHDKAAHLDGQLQTHHPSSRIALHRQSLRHAAASLRHAFKNQKQAKDQRLRFAQQRLENSSLQSTLQRGYSILEDEKGRILDEAAKARAAQSVRARMKDGVVELSRRTRPG